MRALSSVVHLPLTCGHEAAEELVKNPIRNETSLVLVVAVILSAVAIPVMSGFLEPSQPPAVAAVQIADPRDMSSRDDDATAPRPREVELAPDRSERRKPAPAQPAPAPSADELAEDDGGDED